MEVFVIKTNLYLLFTLTLLSFNSHAAECGSWQTVHPDWVWCDEFEDDNALEDNYFEVKRVNGKYGVTQEKAFEGTGSLKATYLPGVLESGNLKLSFGRTPVSPMRNIDEDFDEVYWRFYVLHEAGWLGNPFKMTRATIFTKSDWSQAAVGHLWENASLGLKLDPVSGVVGSSAVTSGYNDFENFTWLGGAPGGFEIYAQENANKWHCVEVHMALNTLNKVDGKFEFWINGELQATRSNLNWRGGYSKYGINAIFLENYSNGKLPQVQSRYMDNFVVSRNRIGCVGDSVISPPKPPSDVTVIKN